MDRLIIDSSVLLSSLLEDDVHHAASQQFFDTLNTRKESSELLFPALILLEIVNVLIRLGRHQEAVFLSHSFSDLEIIPIDEVFVATAVDLFSKFSLKTSDATIVSAVSLADAALVTWDMRILKKAEKLVPVFTPEEYISSVKL